MIAIFEELHDIFGIEGYFIYDLPKRITILNKMPLTIDEKAMKQLITTFMNRQQSAMDMARSFEIFYGIEKRIYFSRFENYIFIALGTNNCDLMMLHQKLSEVWLRFTLKL